MTNLLLMFILLSGFIVRVWGIGFGLPHLYHADEPVVVNHAVAFGTWDFNPHFFHLPPLVSYVLFGLYGIYYLVGRWAGLFMSVDDFGALFISDPTSFYLIGRIVLGALLGTLTVWALYAVVKKNFSKKHAILSALFLAFCFLHVRDSHYIYADIPLILFLVMAFHPVFGVLERGKVKDYLVFGIAAGLVVATKYNGVFIFVPFIAAHFLRSGVRLASIFDGKLFASGLISVIVYSLLNPYTWLDFPKFYSDAHEVTTVEGFTGLSHHFVYSILGGLGIPLALFALAGLLLLFIRPEKKKWIFAAFLLVYYGVICFKGQHYDRYILPLVPFLCFFAADALMFLAEKFRWSGVLTAVLAGILLAPSSAKIVLSNQIFTREDIRTTALRESGLHLPPRSKVALDNPFFMPRLEFTLEQLLEKKSEILSSPEPNPVQLRRVDLKIERAQKKDIPGYELYFLNDKPNVKFLFANPAIPYDVDALRQKEIEYVLISKTNPGEKPRFYEDLRKRTKLIARFTPYKDPKMEWAIDRQPLTGGPFLWKELVLRERNGQIIEVYQL